MTPPPPVFPSAPRSGCRSVCVRGRRVPLVLHACGPADVVLDVRPPEGLGRFAVRFGQVGLGGCCSVCSGYCITAALRQTHGCVVFCTLALGAFRVRVGARGVSSEPLGLCACAVAARGELCAACVVGVADRSFAIVLGLDGGCPCGQCRVLGWVGLGRLGPVFAVWHAIGGEHLRGDSRDPLLRA